MSEQTERGAFPSSIRSGNTIMWDAGMTLREYYAGLALQALCTGKGYSRYAAGEAVDLADELIAALNKSNEE